MQIKNWLSAKSETFSEITGDEFTRRDVLLVNGICACMMVGAVVAGESLLISIIMLGAAVVLAYQLNKNH